MEEVVAEKCVGKGKTRMLILRLSIKIALLRQNTCAEPPKIHRLNQKTGLHERIVCYNKLMIKQFGKENENADWIYLQQFLLFQH